MESFNKKYNYLSDTVSVCWSDCNCRCSTCMDMDMDMDMFMHVRFSSDHSRIFNLSFCISNIVSLKMFFFKGDLQSNVKSVQRFRSWFSLEMGVCF